MPISSECKRVTWGPHGAKNRFGLGLLLSVKGTWRGAAACSAPAAAHCDIPGTTGDGQGCASPLKRWLFVVLQLILHGPTHGPTHSPTCTRGPTRGTTRGARVLSWQTMDRHERHARTAPQTLGRRLGCNLTQGLRSQWRPFQQTSAQWQKS